MTWVPILAVSQVEVTQIITIMCPLGTSLVNYRKRRVVYTHSHRQLLSLKTVSWSYHCIAVFVIRERGYELDITLSPISLPIFPLKANTTVDVIGNHQWKLLKCLVLLVKQPVLSSNIEKPQESGQGRNFNTVYVNFFLLDQQM